MGNRMCVGRRRSVEDRLTRPRRLLRQTSDVDYQKLRRLIRSHKLAPCFDAIDDAQFDPCDLEECPICFFFYPSLNRSKCCGKRICTECFLQMMPSETSQSVQCPFCKTCSYAVEYYGSRTAKEKEFELAEEQKVIEAKIRMQKESQTVDEVVIVDHTRTLAEVHHQFSDMAGPSDGSDVFGPRASLLQKPINRDDFSVTNGFSFRNEGLDVGCEDFMVIEAIWQSLQDSALHKSETNPATYLPSSGPSNIGRLHSESNEVTNAETSLPSDDDELSTLDSAAGDYPGEELFSARS
ncbi:E3 ubiquitin-protein ligase GW2-like isoform X1 [Typha latifolia]|uniref:E3 ubiquitin-protein ligase GW2-like isoform X1 n=1 Tax=Typha latifolia TaxID=4733 RepID=UPI003C2CA419